MLGLLKDALFKGLVILIPIVILYVTFRELLELMVGLATPIADLFPEGTFDVQGQTEIIAILLIVATALVLGAIAMIKPARIAAGWLEDRTLNVVPMYRMLKSLVSAMLNMESERRFKPALFDKGDGSRVPAFLVEPRSDGTAVIMVPWSPTAFAGVVQIVSQDQLEVLPVTLDEFSLAVTHFGLGMSEILDQSEAAAPKEKA